MKSKVQIARVKQVCVTCAKAVHRGVKATPGQLQRARQATVVPVHNRLRTKLTWYDRWHNWRYHHHVHWSVLGFYLFVVIAVTLASVRIALAADLFDNWDFGTPGSYTLDSGLETSGTAVRLKAQGYTTDGSTAALYHLDDASGTSAADSSANANTLSLQNTPTWGTGNLGGGLTLNGTTQYATANDASSLSMTGQQTLEGWFKPSSTFNTNTNTNQTLVDKGSYRVGLDRTSGKMTYEIQNNAASNWTRQLGNDTNGSWTFNHYEVDSSATDGTNYFIGLGGATGDAEAWMWNGSTWAKLGGGGTGWAASTYENVMSMAATSTTLYIGLGADTAGDGDVYSCTISSCSSTWTKIGGDGTGWAVNSIESIRSMTIMGSTLYVGNGDGAGDADVWRYNGGTSWTQIGGDTLNSSWASSTFEGVYSLINDGTNIYAGLGTTTLDAEVWKWNGTSWSQIGGDGTNSSWNTSFETVTALHYFGGNLYVGLGTGFNDAEVWRLSSGTWTKIGGGSTATNSSWSGVNYSSVSSLTSDGTTLYAGTRGNAGGETWSWNGSAWTRMGGAGTSSSWNQAGGGVGNVSGMLYFNSKLYVAPWSVTTYGAQTWTWNGSAWTVTGGGYLNNSWGGYNNSIVDSTTTMNGKMYIGVGDGRNTAMVYEYDGSTARVIGGGAGINSSWGDSVNLTYESVNSMIAYKGNLYVGLGNSAGDGEVWRWNGSAWTKLAGDSLNSTWSTATTVSAMAVWNDKLYVGTSTVGTVYSYDGTTWVKVGGGTGSWSSAMATVASLAVYNNQLCAGTGNVATTAQVWCYTSGTTWTQIGGSGTSSNWSTQNTVTTLTAYGSQLYAGVSDSTLAATEVWGWNGSAWTRIAGDGSASSWSSGSYPTLLSAAVYNGNLYTGMGNAQSSSNGAGDIWQYNGTTWTQVGGDNLNSSWGASIEGVYTLMPYKGKLYAGTGLTGNADALVYSYGNNGYAETSTSSFDTSWRHFAATYDGTTMKIYLNGTQDASTTIGLSVTDNSQVLKVGRGSGSLFPGDGQSFFSGSLDEIRLSNTARSSFTTKPYSDVEQSAILNTAVRTSGILSWESFADSETANGGAVTYRLSDDGGSSWKYWTGSAWGSSSGLTQASSVATINSHIGTFPVGFAGIKWQAVLKGDGTQQVTLNSVTLGSNSDLAAPATNASAIAAAKSSGGTAIASNAWTNDADPYFSWTAGSDAGSGLLGYCAYLGTDNTQNPVTSKGLLGTSPVSSGGTCPFVVSGTSLDLSSGGLLGTPLTTSSSAYYLSLRAIDRAGNVIGSSAQFHFRFDNTPPSNPAYFAGPSQFINTKTATLTWPTSGGDAAADAQSGVAGVQYRINSSTWYGDAHSGAGDATDLLTNDGSYTTVDPPDFGNINEGANTVAMRTWDNAGNVSTATVNAVLKVNTNGAPSTPQNLDVTPASSSNNSFAFDWDPPATYVGSEGGLTYCYTINATPSSSNCTYTAAGVTAIAAGPFATQPGTNTVYVVARDESGGINYATAASATFTANTTAPGIPLNVDIVDVSIKSSSNWRLAITWEEPASVGSGVSSYRVYRSTNNTTFTLIGSSSSTTYIDAGLSQQRYYYKIKACDSTNNCGAETSSVNETPTGKYTEPATQIGDVSISDISTRRATISWTTNRESDSRVAIGTKPGEYASSEIANSAQTSVHSLDLANLAAGTTYYFVAKWTDEDGNIGTSSEYTFSTAPAPVVKEVVTVQVGLNNATIQLTTKSAAQAKLYYGASEGFGGLKVINTSLAESTYTVQLTGLSDGTKYFFKVNTLDAEGNEYDGNTYSFTTPPQPKISNLTFQPVEGEPTSTQRVTWNTNVAATSQVTYGKVGGRSGEIVQSALTTSHEITLRGLEDSSEYQLVAQSRDGSGNTATSDRQLFKTALDTRPPKIADVVVETTIRGTGSEARGQLVVTWKTDEPATSQVAFGEGSSAQSIQSQTTEDANLSTDHLVIVSDLSTARPYTIKALSADGARNQTQSDPQTVLVGRPSESILSIIFNTLQRMFGFIGK